MRFDRWRRSAGRQVRQHRRSAECCDSVGRYTAQVSKTFYIETFGCQMNAHDCEKVIGTLEQQGYAQVQDEAEAGLILYNTCSIRDKAEQKVFHRLNEYKRMQGEGKKFAVLGCVAQQEGEKIFEQAPYVSIVSGSASYRNLPQMLQRLEAGETRITGLDDRQTEETFETEFTSRSNPHRGYITIIEGCDKFCAYCVVPYTRGKERSPDLGVGAGRGAADGRLRVHRDSAAGAECELVPRSAGQDELCGVAGGGGTGGRDPAGAVYDLASASFFEGYCRGDGCGADAVRSRASAGAERIERDV